MTTCELLEDWRFAVGVSCNEGLPRTALLVVSDGDDVTDSVVDVDPDSCGTTRLLDVWLWLVAGDMEEVEDMLPVLDEAMLVTNSVVGVGTKLERA